MNSSAASITSSPLFISVAESTEIFRPIAQVGCLQASSGVIESKVSSGRKRKGPPEAVKVMARTRFRSQSSPLAHWNTALCSLSMGSNCAPLAATLSSNSRPDATRASLFASNTRLPAATAAQVDGSPANPEIPATTTSISVEAAMAVTASSPASTLTKLYREIASRRAIAAAPSTTAQNCG